MNAQLRAVVDEIKKNVCEQVKGMNEANKIVPVKGTRYSLPLEGIPKAIIITAENDNLRAEGEIYIKMLREASVEVKDTMAAGMPHGYYEYGFSGSQEHAFLPEDIVALLSNGAIPKAAQEALDFIDKEYIR